jgi:desulfoferrodoxin (superoxide reductase-like protein)
VRERDVAHAVLDAKRLKSLDLVLSTSRRVPSVPHSMNAPQIHHVLWLEYVSDEAVSAVKFEFSVSCFIFCYRHQTRTFLATVLQTNHSVVHSVCGLLHILQVGQLSSLAANATEYSFNELSGMFRGVRT